MKLYSAVKSAGQILEEGFRGGDHWHLRGVVFFSAAPVCWNDREDYIAVEIDDPAAHNQYDAREDNALYRTDCFAFTADFVNRHRESFEWLTREEVEGIIVHNEFCGH